MVTASERVAPVPRKAGTESVTKDEDRFTIIFTPETGQRLRALARQLELPVSVMLRLWAMDRLGEEERRVRERERER